MTVPLEQDGFVQYTGTGARVFFEFGFTMLDDSGVYVTVDDIPVAFTFQSTGVVLAIAPALNAVVIIFRWTNVDQLTDWEAFDSFKADKTEDAVDKLIILKEEGRFRGLMNLFASPALAWVTLVNNMGDDAVILIWNEHDELVVINDAGVFAGEVTQNMPAAGAVVAKPDHFVYFQYGLAGRIQTLTTTLYPAEALDAMGLGIGLQGGHLLPINEDAVNFGFAFVEGNIETILLSTGPHDDAVNFGFAFVEGNIETILLTTGPHDDAVDFGFAFVEGNLVDVLVNALMPDEAMELGIALISGSMDAV